MVERVRIQGAAELDKVLKELPRRVAAQALNKALMAGATPIVKRARELAPKRPDSGPDSGPKRISKKSSLFRLPGYLKASIMRQRRRRPGSSSALVKIGFAARAFYGRFLELGTSRQAKKPFLRPAFAETGQEALDRIGATLGKDVEAAAKRLAGNFAKSGLATRRGFVSRLLR